MEKTPENQDQRKKDEAEDDDDDNPQWLMDMVKNLQLKDKTKENVEQVLKEVSFQGICDYIASGKCQRIITMAGAGISTSAGIPDFRSPESGLYSKLRENPAFELPDDEPHAIFDINFFKVKPEPFYLLARELYPDPGRFKPTPCHHFLRLLQDKGLLLRHYTQNIDMLEREAGLKDDKLVEAHGSFHSAHCLSCRAKYTPDDLRETVMKCQVPRCTRVVGGEKKECKGLIKPDVVFFGESLDEKFFKCAAQDFPTCDLLIIMGTSLVVQPFASLTNRVPLSTPRLYINREKTMDDGNPLTAIFSAGGSGFQFDSKDNIRDVFFEGNCDDGCAAMAAKLNWTAELAALRGTSSSGTTTAAAAKI